MGRTGPQYEYLTKKQIAELDALPGKDQVFWYSLFEKMFPVDGEKVGLSPYYVRTSFHAGIKRLKESIGQNSQAKRIDKASFNNAVLLPLQDQLPLLQSRQYDVVEYMYELARQLKEQDSFFDDIEEVLAPFIVESE